MIEGLTALFVKMMHQIRILLMIAVLSISVDCFVFKQRLPLWQITPRRSLSDEPNMWFPTTTTLQSVFEDTAKTALKKKAGTRAILPLLDLFRTYWAPELAGPVREYGKQVERSRMENQDFLKRLSDGVVPRGAHRLHRGGGRTSNFFPSPQLTPWIRYASERKATPRVG